MVVKTDGCDDPFGTQNVYIKAAPGVSIGLENRGETKIGTDYKNA